MGPSTESVVLSNGLAQYIEEPEFQHQDFTQMGENVAQTFRVLVLLNSPVIDISHLDFGIVLGLLVGRSWLLIS